MKQNKYMIILNVIVVLFLTTWLFSYLFIPSSNVGNNTVGVAVIPIFGTIDVGSITSSGSQSLFSSMSSSVDSYAIVNQIEKANNDPRVKYIVLDINSPGGSPVGSEEIMQAVKESKKPVYSIIRDIGASGAYWIASASTKVFSSPISLVGAIGVTGSYIQISGFMKKYGIGYEKLVSGPYKDTGTIFRNMTKDERNLTLKKIMEINRYFINSVGENRHLDSKEKQEVDNGEIFTGEEAVKHHLVDGLGTFIDLNNQIHKKENKTVVYITYVKKPSLLEMLLNSKTLIGDTMTSAFKDALTSYFNAQLNGNSKVSLS